MTESLALAVVTWAGVVMVVAIALAGVALAVWMIRELVNDLRK